MPKIGAKVTCGTSISCHPPPRLVDHCGWQGHGMGVGARHQGGPESDSFFWTWLDHGTHEVSAAVAACTRCAEDQAFNIPAWQGRELGELTSSKPLTGELMTLTRFLKGGRVSSLSVCSPWWFDHTPVDAPTSVGIWVIQIRLGEL